jgi:hypothetical protein
LLTASPAFSADWPELLERDLTKHWNTNGNWSLKDGVATLTPRPGQRGWTRWMASLWSKKTYGDFEIEFDYQVQQGGNSGSYLRVADVNDPVALGIELQIYDSASVAADRPLNDRDSGGVIPGVPPQETRRQARRRVEQVSDHEQGRQVDGRAQR